MTEPMFMDVPTLFDLNEVLRVLQPSTSSVSTLPSGHGGVLGAQQLGQYVVLAERHAPDKRALTIQATFVRSGRAGIGLEAATRVRHAGRSFAHVEVELTQGETYVSRADVLLHTPEDGALRGSSPYLEVASPAESIPVKAPLMPWETRQTPDGTTLWQRIEDAGDNPMIWRALLAYTTEIPGLHRVRVAAREQGGNQLPPLDSPVITGSILSQRVSFFEELDVREWHRINVDAWWAEYGRVSVRGSIADESGRIAISFEQIALLRAAPAK